MDMNSLKMEDAAIGLCVKMILVQSVGLFIFTVLYVNALGVFSFLSALAVFEEMFFFTVFTVVPASVITIIYTKRTRLSKFVRKEGAHLPIVGRVALVMFYMSFALQGLLYLNVLRSSFNVLY